MFVVWLSGGLWCLFLLGGGFFFKKMWFTHFVSMKCFLWLIPLFSFVFVEG